MLTYNIICIEKEDISLKICLKNNAFSFDCFFKVMQINLLIEFFSALIKPVRESVSKTRRLVSASYQQDGVQQQKVVEWQQKRGGCQGYELL